MTSAPTLRYERELLRGGVRWLAGVDEVGRGSLAGPVTVGVVLVDLTVRTAPTGLRVIKPPTPAQRQALAPRLRRWAPAWAVGHASRRGDRRRRDSAGAPHRRESARSPSCRNARSRSCSTAPTTGCPAAAHPVRRGRPRGRRTAARADADQGRPDLRLGRRSQRARQDHPRHARWSSSPASTRPTGGPEQGVRQPRAPRRAAGPRRLSSPPPVLELLGGDLADDPEPT